MAELDFLRDFVIIFGVAIGITFLFYHLRIAPIVGYLIAGVLLGPSVLGVAKDVASIKILAEVGVILLLFLIGVEFSLNELIAMNRKMFHVGFLQIILTTAIAGLIAIGIGASIPQGIFVGFLVTMSSTVIVMKVLSDRGEMDSPQGRLTAVILILQDLSVVVIVLLMPVLGGISSFSVPEIVLNVFMVFAFMVLVVIASRSFVPFVLNRVVQTHSRELFLISIVLICFGTAYVTSLVGLSLALGAFIAGLIISESEYGHQAFSEILPLKDIFSILFFVSIGMLLDISIVLRDPWMILAAVAAILAIKFAAGLFVPVIVGYPLRIGALVGISLAQIGEFSFVLSKEGLINGLISSYQYQMFLASAIITMVLTPFMIKGSGKISEYIEVLPLPHNIKLGRSNEEKTERTNITNHVIVVGFGLNGKNVSKVLIKSNIPFMVLELNPETVRVEKKRGISIIYGDATKESVLAHINIKTARSVVIAISDASATRRIVQLARRLNPSVYIIARTRYTNEINPLYSLGANDVIPEEFETSIEIISRVLHHYFIPANEIERHIGDVRKDGYDMLRNLQQKYDVFPDLKIHLPDIEIETFRIMEGSQIAGKTLAEVGFRRKFGVTVLAVQRGKETITNPSGETSLFVHDIMILMGKRESIAGASSLLL